jgi:branched-chain amino acid transport system substrate-binding protein
MSDNHRPRGLAARSSGLVVTLGLTLTLSACGGSSSNSGSTPGAASVDPRLFPGKAASGAPVKIGFINPEGGPAVNQPENREAAEAAATYANENLGGIGGHPIELVVCKSKEDPASARDCANQMVEQKVAAVVLATSGFGDLMVPIVTRAGIPWVSESANGQAELVTPGSFAWSGGFVGVLASWAQYSKDNGVKHFTVYAVDVPAATQGIQTLGQGLFAKAGVKLTLAAIPPGTPDASPQVQAGLKDKPEAVGVVGDATICTSVLKPLGVAGYPGKKLIIQPCVGPDVLAGLDAATLEHSSVWTTADITTQDPEAVLYRAIMKKYAPSTNAFGYAVTGYQGVLGLVRAAAGVSGDPTSAAILAAIKAAKDVPMPAGHGIEISCNGAQLPPMTAPCSPAVLAVNLVKGQVSTQSSEVTKVDPSALFTP